MPRSFWLVLGACLVLAGCNTATGQTAPPPPASITSAPIDSPVPSAPPEPSPSESAAPTEPAVDSVPIPSDAYAIVMASDLRVRSKPGVSGDSKKLEPLLQKDELLVVVDGPVQASGYDWYQIQPVIPVDSGIESAPFGWVALGGKDGEPWIAPTTVSCPPVPEDAYGLTDLNAGAYMFYGVTCFSGQELTIKARLAAPEATCGTEPPWTVEPAWFDDCRSRDYFLAPFEITEALYFPAFAPGVDTSFAGEPDGEQSDWPVVEALGMFDHPAATTCRNHESNVTSVPEPDPAQTILFCRAEFVVTSMREVEG
jgi:hypothetical protein